MLFGRGVGVVVSSVLEAEVVIDVVGYSMAGVRPVVCPIDLCHFVHGFFARAARQVAFTVAGKFSFTDCLGEGAKESDAVLLVEVGEEFILLEVDPVEELGPAYPSPVELGICGWCAGFFSGIASS